MDECYRCENVIDHLRDRIHELEYLVNKLEHVNEELNEELNKLNSNSWSVELWEIPLK